VPSLCQGNQSTCWKHCTLDSVELKGLQLRDCIASCSLSVPLALAGSQRLLYRLFCRIQASSLQWLRLTGVLGVPGIQSAPLPRCPGALNPLVSDTTALQEGTKGSEEQATPSCQQVQVSRCNLMVGHDAKHLLT